MPESRFPSKPPRDAIHSSAIERQGIVAFHLLCALSTLFSLLFYHFTLTWIAAALGLFLVLTLFCSIFLLSRPAWRRHLAAGGFLWLVLAMGGGEAVLSLQEGIWSGYRFDQHLGWGLRPNLNDHLLQSAQGPYSVSTDAMGYRNDPDHKGKWDILLQGDSNALGFGLNNQEHFCAAMEKRHHRSCFNAGITGYDPHHYFIQYQSLKQRVPNARRVVMFSLGNDLGTTALSTPYAMPRPVVEILEGNKSNIHPADPMPIPMQIYGHHFLPHLRDFDDGLETIEPGRDWGYSLPRWLQSLHLPLFYIELIYPRAKEWALKNFAPADYTHGRRYNPYFPEWKTRAIKEWPEPYQRHLPDFDRLMAAMAAQNHSSQPMILVLAPMREQGIPGLLPQRSLNEILTLNNHLAELGKKHGFSVVDPTPLFREQPDPKAMFQPDHHLSARAMELLVDQVFHVVAGS